MATKLDATELQDMKVKQMIALVVGITSLVLSPYMGGFLGRRFALRLVRPAKRLLHRHDRIRTYFVNSASMKHP